MSDDARFCLCANHKPLNKRYVACVCSCRFIEDSVQQAFVYLQEKRKWSDSNLEDVSKCMRFHSCTMPESYLPLLVFGQ